MALVSKEQNPGKGVAIRVSSGGGEEELNLLDILAQTLGAAGHEVRRLPVSVEHVESGLRFAPQIAGLEAADEGGFRTLTTIQVEHAELLPDGAFEYQHSSGDSLRQSIEQGFEAWVQGDLIALCDALRGDAEHCQTIVLQIPARGAEPARTRRAVLGPVWRFTERPSSEARARPGDDSDHDFCPCCLLTKSFDAFADLLQGEATYCIRLYAARHPDGPGADCRVNGADHEPGAQALMRYAGTWTEAGVEFRKQYVVIHNVPL